MSILDDIEYLIQNGYYNQIERAFKDIVIPEYENGSFEFGKFMEGGYYFDEYSKNLHYNHFKIFTNGKVSVGQKNDYNQQVINVVKILVRKSRIQNFSNSDEATL
jgi:hypothetical protein